MIRSKKTLEALNKVVDFLDNKGIDYVVTGTVALELLGLNMTEPGDIDILVDPARYSVFSDLALLSTTQDPNYETETLTFYVTGDIKVNIMSLKDQEPFLKITGINGKVLNVHTVNQALVAKLSLGRPKDSNYLIQLIKKLTNLI